jgi:hypothetical protein
MTPLPNLIAHLHTVLASNQRDPVMLRRVATEYSTACHELNARLARCLQAVKAGQLPLAQQLAFAEPLLLDTVTTLDFPGRLRWIQLLQQHQIPGPPPLRVDLVPLLRAAGVGASPLELPVSPPATATSKAATLRAAATATVGSPVGSPASNLPASKTGGDDVIVLHAVKPQATVPPPLQPGQVFPPSAAPWGMPPARLSAPGLGSPGVAGQRGSEPVMLTRRQAAVGGALLLGAMVVILLGFALAMRPAAAPVPPLATRDAESTGGGEGEAPAVGPASDRGLPPLARIPTSSPTNLPPSTAAAAASSLAPPLAVPVSAASPPPPVERAPVGTGGFATSPEPRPKLTGGVVPSFFVSYPEPTEEVPSPEATSALAARQSLLGEPKPITLWRSRPVPAPTRVRFIGADGEFVVQPGAVAGVQWTVAHRSAADRALAQLELAENQGRSELHFHWSAQATKSPEHCEALRRCVLEITWEKNELHFLLTRPVRTAAVELSATFERTLVVPREATSPEGESPDEAALSVGLVGAERFSVGRVVRTPQLAAVLLAGEPRIGIRAQVLNNFRGSGIRFQLGVCTAGSDSLEEFRPIEAREALALRNVAMQGGEQRRVTELREELGMLRRRREETVDSEEKLALTLRMNRTEAELLAYEKLQAAAWRKFGLELGDVPLRLALMAQVGEWAAGPPRLHATLYRRVPDAARSRAFDVPVRVYGDHLAAVEVVDP